MQLTHLGPYVIEKPLGKGGMGSVYAAQDPQTRQRVAIKALSPHLAAAEGFRERFEAEIESLKTLRHDGIVRLYGYGEQDGVLFYSMELVEGTSLEDELRAGRRFNWREVTNIAIQLSLALKHAHDHGIVHRDIKPANILLAQEDRVKLADFGIARLFGMTSLTTAGGVLGTADYMSPEQADGRPVTARCDQYSLGGVMYALLAGRPPFRAKSLPQMLQMQRFADPEPVRRFAPDTPEQLEGVIMQLLAKEPAARFPNTQVLARHLQAMVNALSRPAAEDFAISPESPAVPMRNADAGESISAAATQAEAPVDSGSNENSSPSSSAIYHASTSQNAITLGADESVASPNLRSVSIQLVPDQVAAAPQPVERPTRFTTIEQEEAARSISATKPWLLIAAQFTLFVAVLGSIGGILTYVARPPSADTLHATVMARLGEGDDTSLGAIENEISDFLKRFPQDPRAKALRAVQERLELDKLERRLQRQVRGGWTIDTSLLPAERLYLAAAGMAATSPERSLELLQALVDLYAAGSDAGDGKSSSALAGNPISRRDDASRTVIMVQLANRRIAALQADLKKQHEQHLAALHERLATANRLKSTKPEQAAAICRAIVTLHASDDWASAVVEQAQKQLAELAK